MKKKITKIVLECVFYIALLFVPFIFANYFLTNYYLENGKFFWNLDTLLRVALEWLSVIIVSLLIRKKNKGVVSENLERSKKVFIVSLVMWVVLTISVNWGSYPDLYGTISNTLGVFDNWHLALAVTWEQYFNGMFFMSCLMSVTICFFNKKYFKKS